jgi:hypothetical protein
MAAFLNFSPFVAWVGQAFQPVILGCTVYGVLLTLNDSSQDLNYVESGHYSFPRRPVILSKSRYCNGRKDDRLEMALPLSYAANKPGLGQVT